MKNDMHPFLFVFFLLIFLFMGFWFGLNYGIAASLTQGPVKACENLRFSMIICEEKYK